MDSDGRNRTKLTASAQAETDAEGSTTPAWSSDGAFIAYSSSGEAVEENQRNIEIYVMRADGSEPRRLTNDRVFDAMPAWSPDGKRIAFTHIPALGDEDADGVLIVIGPDGRGRSQLAAPSRHSRGRLRLAPEVVAGRQLGRLYPSDGHPRRQTPCRHSRHRSDRHGRAPTDRGRGRARLVARWKQDRLYEHTRLQRQDVLRGMQPERREGQADGTGVHRLTRSQAQDQRPPWTSDGEHIAFVSDRSNRADHEYEIYVMSSDGSGLRRLTTNHVWDLEPAVRPG